ncbi:paraquat-inducible protein A [Candidatus Binatia bacterium]|nr:paraquat-inducible protein A [Candidatus Binatia bacterium]
MHNRPLPDPALVACLHCDLVQRLPVLAPGDAARCPRCDKLLWRHGADVLNRTLALTVAAGILYLIANLAPMLGLEAVGRTAETTVLGGAQQLWRDGRETVAVLVLFTVVIAPALQIGFLIAILLGAQRPCPPRWIAPLLRMHPATQIWSMIEVMLIGVLVALVKIAELATVVPGLALYALAGLAVSFAAIQSIFDPHEVWERIEWADTAEARVQDLGDVAPEAP